MVAFTSERHFTEGDYFEIQKSNILHYTNHLNTQRLKNEQPEHR